MPRPKGGNVRKKLVASHSADASPGELVSISNARGILDCAVQGQAGPSDPQVLELALAPSTRRQYDSTLTGFLTWCNSTGQRWPLGPDQLFLYVEEMITGDAEVAGIKDVISRIQNRLISFSIRRPELVITCPLAWNLTRGRLHHAVVSNAARCKANPLEFADHDLLQTSSARCVLAFWLSIGCRKCTIIGMSRDDIGPPVDGWCTVTLKDVRVQRESGHVSWAPEALASAAKPYLDRKSTRLNSSHSQQSRMPSSA